MRKTGNSLAPILVLVLTLIEMAGSVRAQLGKSLVTNNTVVRACDEMAYGAESIGPDVSQDRRW